MHHGELVKMRMQCLWYFDGSCCGVLQKIFYRPVDRDPLMKQTPSSQKILESVIGLYIVFLHIVELGWIDLLLPTCFHFSDTSPFPWGRVHTTSRTVAEPATLTCVPDVTNRNLDNSGSGAASHLHVRRTGQTAWPFQTKYWSTSDRSLVSSFFCLWFQHDFFMNIYVCIDCIIDYIIKVLFFGEVHAIHRAGHRPPESPKSNLLYYSSVLPVAVKPVLRWNRDTRHNPLGRSMTRSPQLIYQLNISCGGRFASFSFCIFWDSKLPMVASTLFTTPREGHPGSFLMVFVRWFEERQDQCTWLRCSISSGRWWTNHHLDAWLNGSRRWTMECKSNGQRSRVGASRVITSE